MKFRTRAFLFVATLLILTTFMVSLGFSIMSENLVRSLFTDFMVDRNKFTSDGLERTIFERAGDLKVLSANPIIKRWEMDPNAVKSLLSEVQMAYKTYDNLMIVDANYRVRISTDNAGPGKMFESPEALSKQNGKNDPIRTYIKTEKLDKSGIYFVSSLGVKGFIVAFVPFHRLKDVFANFESPIATYIHPHYELRDRYGELLFSASAEKPEGSIGIGKIDSYKHQVNDIWSSDKLLVVRSPVVLKDLVNNEDWSLTATVSWNEIFVPIQKTTYWVMTFIVGVLAVAAVLVRQMVIKSLKPLEDLTKALPKINEGQFDKIEGHSDRKDEFAEVIDGFNQMTSTLQNNIEEMSNSSKFAALGEMSAGIAHEINNPLTIIRGYATIVERAWLQQDETRMRESIEKIHKTVDRIAKIVRALKTYARKGDGEPSKPESVEALLKDVTEFCREKFTFDGIKVELKNNDPNAMINCVSVKISQVLINLLNNAYDAVKEESSKERWIQIECSSKGDRAAIAITNSGSRIHQDIVKKLFTPFYTTKEVGKGTGLGLSISKGMIESHGGRIFVDMTCPNTRFVIDLPLYVEDQKLKAA